MTRFTESNETSEVIIRGGGEMGVIMMKMYYTRDEQREDANGGIQWSR